MDKKEIALNQHEKWAGKIEVISRASVSNKEELSVAQQKTTEINIPGREESLYITHDEFHDNQFQNRKDKRRIDALLADG